MNSYDFVIVGGGVIGLSLALNLKKKFPDLSVLIIEKEKTLAFHASGRNSGVLHAGFYYTSDSLKAKFTREGNATIRQYCQDKKIQVNNCGKLVVCKNEADLLGLDELEKRAKHNSVELYRISEKEAKSIEPRVITMKNALWSPTTCSVDPVQVMDSLLVDALEIGVKVVTDTCYLYSDRKNREIVTNKDNYNYGYFVNAAGLYADKIAIEWDFSKNYRILPFKGLYLYSNPSLYKPKTHIYPVPDLNFPFLGVHFTLTVDGLAKIGPTAIPAFWRENYQGFDRFNISEAIEIVYREAGLWMRNKFDFRTLASAEIRKYNKKNMIKDASSMLDNAHELDFDKWGKPGIRAQLVDIDKGKLEMDFVFEGDKESFHILNAVSPAFTCSIPFTNYLVSKIEKLIK
jgi:(S)-2-hydroxyglutarate dehydrogenase